MAFFGLLGRGKYERRGFELYTAAVTAARNPYFYTDLGVPDTLDGRFDLVGLYASMLIRRLRNLPAPGPAVAQAVFDAMFSDMDFNLREMGVGDMRVARNVRAMWEAFHGRALTYEAALDQGDPAVLQAAIVRNVWRGADAAGAAELAGIIQQQMRAVDAVPVADLIAGRIAIHCAVHTGAGVTTELPRPLPADRVGRLGLTVSTDATPPECAAIAARLQVPSVGSVRCDWTLRSLPGGCIEAEGHLQASLEQLCVVSLDAFPVLMDEAFVVRFVPAGEESEAADDPDQPDELPIVDGTIDLGEAAVEQLALSLDPYPRKPGAELPQEGLDGPVTPFAALAKLRRPQ